MNANSLYSSKYVLLSGDLRDNLNTLHSEMEYFDTNNINENENDDGTLSMDDTPCKEATYNIMSTPSLLSEGQIWNEDLKDVFIKNIK